MDAIVPLYGIVLPWVVVAFGLFGHYQYNAGNGDLAGVFEVAIPSIILMGIHVAAYAQHWVLALAITTTELVLLIIMCRHIQRRHRQEKETRNAAETTVLLAAQRKREAFAARMYLPADHPGIDSAYALLTEEARNSVQDRDQLAALLGELADEKQKVLRRKRLFKNE